MKLLILLLLGLNLNNAFSKDSIGVCRPTSPQLENMESPVVAANVVIDEKSESIFCFDSKANSDDTKLVEDFRLLEFMGLFDKNGCLIDKNKNAENEALVSKFVKDNLGKRVQIFATMNPGTQKVNLIYTNSEDKKFANTALTSKDKWQMAGYSATSISLGVLVSEQIYKGQKDKKGHALAGAVISGLTTGATYLILETSGLGDYLNLSAETKKTLIMFSGPMMGMIAGAAKEFSDSRDPANHTTDIHDFGATSLGAGAPLVFTYKILF